MCIRRAFIFSCATLLLAGSPPGAATAAVPGTTNLSTLADEFYIARAHFDPLNYATANGDSRFDDQIGMSIAPQVRADYYAHIHRLQRQQASIPRAGLSDADKLDDDILAFELGSSLDLEPYPEHLLPISQMDNVPSTLANYANGTGSQPLTTPAQYRAYLQRLRQLPGWIDQAIANMRVGVRSGIVLPTSIIRAMLPQFEQLMSTTPESSIYYTPINNLPAAFSASDKEQLTAAYRAVLADQLSPALGRLNRFLHDEYLAAGRNTSGLGALPNGAAWYLARIKNNTNLALAPAAIHVLGLQEVTRIQAQLTELGPKLGYDGPPRQLAQWVFEQKKYRPFTSDTRCSRLPETLRGRRSAATGVFSHPAQGETVDRARTGTDACDRFRSLHADGGRWFPSRRVLARRE